MALSLLLKLLRMRYRLPDCLLRIAPLTRGEERIGDELDGILLRWTIEEGRVHGIAKGAFEDLDGPWVNRVHACAAGL
jgi:hypothetical protein